MGNVLHFSQQLDILHKHITSKELSVKKRDTFDEQCILLEEYVGGDSYKNTYKKMRTLNILSGIVALPILFLIVAVIIYSKINESFDVFAFVFNNKSIWIISGILFVGVLMVAFSFYIVKRKLYYKIYPELKDTLKIDL